MDRFVNIVQKDSVDYEVRDARIPQPELEDVNKALIVDEEGAYELKDITVDAYTKAETDDLLAIKADSDDVYDKDAVDSLLAGKQDTLVSGTNIKTINGETLLGNTDITLPTVADVAAKQDTLVSGESIKTINGQSVLGAGNIDIDKAIVIDLGILQEFEEEGTEVEITQQQFELAKNNDDVIVKFNLGGFETIQLAKFLSFAQGENSDTVMFNQVVSMGELSGVVIQLEKRDDTYKALIHITAVELPEVDANVSSEKDEDLRNIEIDGTVYGIPQGGIETTDDFTYVSVAPNEGKIYQYVGSDVNIKDTIKYKNRFTIEIDQETFAEKVEFVAGDYTFTYSDGEWDKDFDEYGITFSSDDLVDGDAFVVSYKDGTLKVNDQITALYWSDPSIVDFTELFEGGAGTQTTITKNIEAWVNDYSGVSANVSDANVFVNKMYPGNAVGIKQDFRFEYNGSAWTYEDQVVNLTEYGITVSDIYEPSNAWFKVYCEIDVKFTGKFINILTGYSSDRDTYYSFSALDSGDLILSIPEEESGTVIPQSIHEAERPMYTTAKGWDAYATTMFFMYVPSLTIIDVVDNDIWCNWISKVDFPLIAVTENLVPRMEIELDKDLLREQVVVGKQLVLEYHDGDWCKTYVAEGTSLSQFVSAESGGSFDKIYYNTHLTVAEMNELANDPNVPWQSGGSGGSVNMLNGFVALDSGDSTIAMNYIANGMGGQLILTMGEEEPESETDMIVYCSMPLYEQYFGVSEGWAKSSFDLPINTWKLQLPTGAENYIDKLYSLTPYTLEYDIIDLNEYGISISGDYEDGDQIIIDTTANGLEKFELYRITREDPNGEINVGDELSTIYFDTAYTPTVDDFPNLMQSYPGTKLGTIYSNDLYSDGLYVINFQTNPSGSESPMDGIVIGTKLNTSGGSGSSAEMWKYLLISDSIVYTSVSIPEFSIEAGWVKNSVTYNPTVIAASSQSLYGQVLISTDNIECAKKFVSTIPYGVIVEPKFVPYKFYLSADEVKADVSNIIDLGNIDINYPASSTANTEFLPTDEQMKKLKDCLDMGLTPSIKFSFEENYEKLECIVPLVSHTVDDNYPEDEVYLFATAMHYDGDLAINITIYPNYDGIAMGSIQLDISSSSGGVTSFAGVSGNIYIDTSRFNMNGNTLGLLESGEAKYIKEHNIEINGGQSYGSIVDFKFDLIVGDNDPSYYDTFNNYNTLYNFLNSKGMSTVYGTGVVGDYSQQGSQLIYINRVLFNYDSITVYYYSGFESGSPSFYENSTTIYSQYLNINDNNYMTTIRTFKPGN